MLQLLVVYKNDKKNKKIYFLIILLLLIALIYINTISISSVLATCTVTLNKVIYTHDSSNEIIINLYNVTKNYRFQITSDYIKHLADEKIIWFVQPEITIFNKKDIPIWTISCNQAKLIENNTLDLCGYVYINKIINSKYSESIITKRASISFTGRSMISNTITIIHGCYFYSISSKMYIDLENQIIELFGKIYTQYRS